MVPVNEIPPRSRSRVLTLRGGTFPHEFTCDGANRLPRLQWITPPPGTQELAIELLDTDKNSPSGKDITAWALLSWARLENVPVASLVEPDAMPAFESIAKDCIQSLPQFEHIEHDERPLQHEQFLKINPTKVEPWRSMMEHNSPGQEPAGAPVFIAQGTADTTVNPEITTRFGEALCAQDTRVSFIRLTGVTHTFAARDSAGAALAWMTARFEGVPAPSDCER